MSKTTQNDIKIDVIGFFMELAAEVEKTENVTLDPILLKSLKNIKKDYEIPYDQRNVETAIQGDKNINIVEKVNQVETAEKSKTTKARTPNPKKKTKNDPEIEDTYQGFEID